METLPTPFCCLEFYFHRSHTYVMYYCLNGIKFILSLIDRTLFAPKSLLFPVIAECLLYRPDHECVFFIVLDQQSKFLFSQYISIWYELCHCALCNRSSLGATSTTELQIGSYSIRIGKTGHSWSSY